MASHTTLAGGIRLTLGKTGIRFTKKPTRFNNCIGDAMRKKTFGSRAAAKAAFSSAAKDC